MQVGSHFYCVTFTVSLLGRCNVLCFVPTAQAVLSSRMVMVVLGSLTFWQVSLCVVQFVYVCEDEVMAIADSCDAYTVISRQFYFFSCIQEALVSQVCCLCIRRAVKGLFYIFYKVGFCRWGYTVEDICYSFFLVFVLRSMVLIYV